MMEAVHDDLDGSDMGIVWMGDVPFLALVSADPDGLVGRWLAKNGPGVQPLAWEVPDMWASQNHLVQAGIVANGRGSLHSVTLAVDLDTAPAGLGTAGITIACEQPGSLWLEPADTFGIRLQLVDA